MKKNDKTKTYSDSNKTTTYGDSEKRTKETVHNIKAGDNIILNNIEYKIIEIISESTGEAVIYKIEDAVQKILALKLYFEFNNAENEPNTEALTRIKAIDDVDILKLIDFGTGINKYKGKYCFEISDFASGHDLLRVENLKEKYKPGFIEKEVIPQIFKGILRLHENKIFHCDLKPQNVFYLDKEQIEIVIGDYGSAKTFEFDAEKKSRKTTTVKGTDFYLPPEQARGFISEKNDYYSFGMILLHLFYPEKILLNENEPKSLSHSKLKQIIERQFEAKPIIDYNPKFDRINKLIEGLTLVDFNLRWGENEIKSWLEGKNVDVLYKKEVKRDMSSAASAKTLIFGNYKIRSVYDLRNYILNEKNWYTDLLEDRDNREDFMEWLLGFCESDRSIRSEFNRIVKYYSQEGQEFVAEAIIRFLIPEHPVVFGLKSFDFSSDAYIKETTAKAFSYLMTDLWNNSTNEDLKLYIFRYELALRDASDRLKTKNTSIGLSGTDQTDNFIVPVIILYKILGVKKKIDPKFTDFRTNAYEKINQDSMYLLTQFLFNYLESNILIKYIQVVESNALEYKINRTLENYFTTIGIKQYPVENTDSRKIHLLYPAKHLDFDDFCRQTTDLTTDKICKNNAVKKKHILPESYQKFNDDFKNNFSKKIKELKNETTVLEKNYSEILKSEREFTAQINDVKNISKNEEYHLVFPALYKIPNLKANGNKLLKRHKLLTERKRQYESERKKRRFKTITKYIIFLLFFVIISRNSEIKQDISHKYSHKNFSYHDLDLIFVKGGKFNMGAEDGYKGEVPVHNVVLRNFYISKYEITNEQFCKFLNEYGSVNVKTGVYRKEAMLGSYFRKNNPGMRKSRNIWNPVPDCEKKPVVGITWYGANEYCKWYGGRLPTEAEWEFAARGGIYSKGYEYSGSDVYIFVASSSDSENKTEKVGQKNPNEIGLYDMTGNVWEWCEDTYDEEYYENCPVFDPCNERSMKTIYGRSGNSKLTHSEWRYYRTGSTIDQITYKSIRGSSSGSYSYQSNIGKRDYKEKFTAEDDLGFRFCYDDMPDDITKNFREICENNSLTVSKTEELQKPELRMIYVQGKDFEMGDSYNYYYSDFRRHDVTLSDFYISNLEITNQDFCKFLNMYGSDHVKFGEYKGKLMILPSSTSKKYNWGVHKINNEWIPVKGYENHPVIFVSWYGANEFCIRAGGRLPTEAEWEYAARGGNKSRGCPYSGSGILENVSWYLSNSENKSHRVGSKDPNRLGIYDMSGNVMEWCIDTYSSKYYRDSPRKNPCNLELGKQKVIRGGAYTKSSKYLKIYLRFKQYPGDFNNITGFRIVFQIK